MNEAVREEVAMTTERWVRLIAGTLVTLSGVLSWVHSPYWFLFTLVLGLSLAQSALTGWCPMETILRSLRARA
jgi:DUF2892 family protein